MNNYIGLNSDQMQENIDLLLTLWDSFLQKTVPAYISECKRMDQSCEKLENCDIKRIYYVNLLALRELFERTHQREDYFIRYHHNLQMSNFKEIGLIAFWLIKLKPFRLKEEYFDELFDLKINEEFALYFIFNAVARYAKEQGYTYNLKKINSELYNELLYTMQYRDISKEAFGCLVELISIATRMK